jgi:hypothetical protein
MTMTLSEETQIAGALIAFAEATLAIASFGWSIYERRRDLRWRKAQAARDFVNEMHQHEVVGPAIFMLDWLDTKW